MKKDEQRQRMREYNPMYDKKTAMKSGAKHKTPVVIDNIRYDGLVDAAQFFNTSTENIRQWCKCGKNPEGLVCYYENPSKKSNRGNKVIVDGVLYCSGSEAAYTLGLKPVTLNKALREHKHFCMGHTCEYANQQPN